MSAPFRFLGAAMLAWVGVRAASLAYFPGRTALVPVPAPARAVAEPVAAPLQTAFEPPAPPMAAMMPAYGPPPAPYPLYPPVAVSVPSQRIVVVPAGYSPAALPVRPRAASWDLADVPRSIDFAPGSPEPWPGRPASPRAASGPASGGGGLATTPEAPARPRFDRLQLAAWALLRGQPGPATLASGGMLGGSQAGARLTWRFNNVIAATLRSSSSIGGIRGAEVAGGVRLGPFGGVPVTLTLERRQKLNRWGGRSAWAALVEGGLYQRPVMAGFKLDGYVQGGVVGLRSRDLFVDGGASLTRRLWRNWSAGVGLWGGAQPGLYRLDAGPRLTLDVGRGIRVHADYRHRLTGNALPTSGPVLTIAGDF